MYQHAEKGCGILVTPSCYKRVSENIGAVYTPTLPDGVSSFTIEVQWRDKMSGTIRASLCK